jgi:hypothetical protein
LPPQIPIQNEAFESSLVHATMEGIVTSAVTRLNTVVPWATSRYPVQTGPLACAEMAGVRVRADTRAAVRADTAAIDLLNFTAGLCVRGNSGLAAPHPSRGNRPGLIGRVNSILPAGDIWTGAA